MTVLFDYINMVQLSGTIYLLISRIRLHICNYTQRETIDFVLANVIQQHKTEIFQKISKGYNLHKIQYGLVL